MRPFERRYPVTLTSYHQHRLFKGVKLTLIVLSSVLVALALYESKIIIDGELQRHFVWLILLGSVLILISILIGAYRNHCILLAKAYGRFIIPPLWSSETFRVASLYFVAYFSVVGSYALSLGLRKFFPVIIAELMFYLIVVLR